MTAQDPDPATGGGPGVLFVNHAGVLGGGELSLLTLVRRRPGRSRVLLLEPGPFRERLAEAGVDVALTASGASLRSIRRDGSAASTLGRAARAAPDGLALVAGLAREARGFDAVCANSQKAMAVAGPAALWARRPLVWHLRDILSPEHFGRAQRTLVVRIANACATRVIANSHAARRAFEAAGGDPRRVVVVHNGLDAPPADAAHEADRLRAELAPDGARLLGLFGRISPWKGQHVAVEAMRTLPATARLLIVGDVLFGEDAYADELRALVERRGLGGRVRFMGHRGDVAALMRACDAVLHTSVAPEPFGRVVVEGMLAGRPVVAADGGGVPEIVEHERTGLLVPPDRPDALAAAVARLLERPDWARTLAARGEAEARARFSVAAYVAGVEAVLREAAGTARAGRT